MENNLYYTPTIEEFHVGFEYEYNSEIFEDWKTCNSADLEDCYHAVQDISQNLETKYRVKTLDQSDIESLELNGFEITEYVEESHLEFTWFKGIELFGLLTFTDKMISFYEYNYSTREYSDCIFRGTIKNRSELIKLMQQLNIK